MPKTKQKVQKSRVPEGKLLKALAELEEAIEKGDPLEDADPEGGLSTEGTPLSNAAPSGKSDTKKSRRSSSSSSMASSVEKAEDDDDDSDSESGDDDSSSGDDASSPFPPKKAKKSMAKAAAESSSDDDESSDDDSSTEKSFREVVEENDETIAKGIEVNGFLEAIVDQLSLAMFHMGEKIAKSLGEIEGRLNARLDNRVAKSVAFQQNFNARLAKAVAEIGNTVQGDVLDMIKSLGELPMQQAPRGKAMLSKGEVNQPPWGATTADANMANGSGGDFTAELAEISSEKIGDWLFKSAANNKLDPQLIMMWEAERYNPEVLPVQVRKALVNDLLK